ncbi:MAG: radical SAM/SPASM family putative metalloenzyme maturase [Desulfuromonadales bacterium]|nr:radical SAM/SPASM family putative metalloenzyme maturase [Desulfuromonadales bacterium]
MSCPAPPAAAGEGRPGLKGQPSKLFVETTTRCNLNCVMCMKQSAQSFADGDLQPATFAALESAFPHLEALILNGIGEPLLSRRLERFIGRAKELMPAQSWVGFQSNGLLLTNLRAISLAEAGVDRICLSMDGVAAETFSALREGGQLRDLEGALSALRHARTACRRPELQVGVEFVIVRENLRELPSALRWAAARGATFALASHVLPYDEAHVGQCAYDLCSDEALALFQRWQRKAKRVGVDLHQFFQVLWKYDKSPEEQRLINLVGSMKIEAQRRGITLDLKRLLVTDRSRLDEVAEVFAEAQAVARETGLALRLPAIAPQERRRCDFVEEGGAFVSWDGKVHPCYYLWHACRSFASGWLHPVQPRTFGHLGDRGLLEIWRSPAFRTYRENVLRHDYPFCPGCNFAPCDYVQAENFEHDCYVNGEPCGSCLWSAGLFQCLS